MNIELKRLTESAKIPQRQSEFAAGYDLHASTYAERIIRPGEYDVIPTGIAVHIKDVHVVGKIYTRSGNGFKHGVVLRNGTGVIDSDYQGEIFICLLNEGFMDFIVKPGDRIAQIIFTNTIPVLFHEVRQFTINSERGERGIGSTGRD